MDYARKPFAYFGTLLRKAKVIPLEELEDELEKNLTDQEISELAPLDLLVRGRLKNAADSNFIWLAVGVSSVVDKNDVERAYRRAALLRKAGLTTIPTVAALDITEGGSDSGQGARCPGPPGWA